MDVEPIFLGVDIGSVNRAGGFSWVMPTDGSLLGVRPVPIGAGRTLG